MWPGVFSTESHRADLLWLLVAFIAFFSVSQGAVIWVYIGEVFPTAVRSKGQGVGSASHWVMAAVIAQMFPIVVTMMRHRNAVYILRGHDGGAVSGSPLRVSRNQRQTLEQLQRRLMRT
ncbi:MAG: MFS transporter [Terracidiphilus sp.]